MPQINEAFLHRNEIDFHYLDLGDGLPFFLQHGLGGDVSQPIELYAPPPSVRLVTMDARGHGATRPTGTAAYFTFDAFADDLYALAGHLGLPSFVVGGISMGAGVALNLALRYPTRVRGLVLVRPAWLEQPMPENLASMVTVGELIQRFGAPTARRRFLDTPIYQALRATAPYTADSLLGQFDEARAEDAVVRLQRMPEDAPNRHRAAWEALHTPTLILANQEDPMHPFAYATTLAEAIAGATLIEVTSKAVDKTRHIAEVRQAINAFLQEVQSTGAL